MSDGFIPTRTPLEEIAMSYGHKYFQKNSVRAATYLERDSTTEVIDVARLTQRSNSVIRRAKIADEKGHLYCVDNAVNASYWIRIVTIAKDCQSNNVMLTNTDEGIILKTVRTIMPGEPLLMWFNEAILAMMNMPFLSLPNIQGKNKYTCHICNCSFESPNPLKIHLALRCNQLDASHLWNTFAEEYLTTIKLGYRIAQPIMMRTSPHIHSPSGTYFSTSTSSNELLSTTSGTISPHNSSVEISPLQAPPCLMPASSAFRPYVAAGYVSHPPPIVDHNVYHTQTLVSQMRNDMADPAQVETIVSNLGKSNKGHVCFYCGKIYSRKYGLKIHVRTHTGYKPLKCKYCLRPFGDPSNLNKHVRLHAEGETPYKCDLCGKVLVRRRDLERHMKSRHQSNADQETSTLPTNNV
ncbi:zinc finger protein 728 [Chelonus insularis]|uniref:zinc finger protein 728 n=1 Tax=Chelonus insularis TaxID=460826 RepID=UPI00158D72AA|nr:zinc finger protein 728 [Chelonus insularis]